MRPMRWTAAIAAGYVLGTFPTASVVARRASRGAVDLRDAGSGNPGAANALAVLGPAAGAQVLAGDVAKGVVACVAGGAIAGPVGMHLGGTAAVTGHCYPVWTGFRGGKGVATSVGQCLATFPAYFPIDVAVAVATATRPRWRRRAFAATAVASTTWVVAGEVWRRRGWANAWGPPVTLATPLAAAISSLVIAERFVAAERAAPPGPDRLAPPPAVTPTRSRPAERAATGGPGSRVDSIAGPAFQEDPVG